MSERDIRTSNGTSIGGMTRRTLRNPIPPLQRRLICLNPRFVLKGKVLCSKVSALSFARPLVRLSRSCARRLIRISDRSIAIAMALPSWLPSSSAAARAPVQRAQDGQHQSVGQTFSVLLSFRRHKAPLLRLRHHSAALSLSLSLALTGQTVFLWPPCVMVMVWF